MSGGNKTIIDAKKNKNDDFYTQLTDIEKELKHYKDHFKNKTVYCNCDDPKISNFFHYFSYNFEKLQLKKLITTCYKNNQPDLFSTYKKSEAVSLVYEGDKNNNKIPDDEEIGVNTLKGDGDFRSDECLEFLKEADIVVTNPPFSLFREYIDQLVSHKKNFIILGQQNSITYKDVFKLIRDGKVWLGNDNGGTKWFEVQDHYDIKTESRKKIVDGKKYFSMGSVVWFTNLDIKKRHEELILYKKFNEKDYPRYDQYDAINVNKVADIPADYSGKMGVPVTFIDKHNPDQFEILGIDRYIEDNPSYGKRFTINGKEIYARILIKNKKL